ncbi:DUF6691 family protein [Candidatus Macondimonas diazotrophica]|jgi:hypothetical protein|uniref:YeeE/YedE family protein n=1 Tax=Candidatus Macondimonas diazotrophica TaxID=2305248 RepID=A0A4Z0FCK9_9GAMM|nr:DUF6691 family protein [Candidatus Macondimonas diazotrophica]NCU00718.1 YeeE/YedE family protein [Candidatus Macondimonas diazotrophica]TFZ83496.1 YeeE/YedE family protein [Candidatus Macondimonas diazotrophica]
MRALAAAFVAGLLFGIGLFMAQMVNPHKVIAFLNVRSDWDPSLALVMGSAVLVTAVGFPLVFRRRSPLWASTFSLPDYHDIDRRLLGGAALFGIGWGIAGYCPGPAVAALLINPAEAIPFVAAMLLGAWMQSRRTPG